MKFRKGSTHIVIIIIAIIIVDIVGSSIFLVILLNALCLITHSYIVFLNINTVLISVIVSVIVPVIVANIVIISVTLIKSCIGGGGWFSD